MEAPVQEELKKDYAQSFVEAFGPISRNQDFNFSEEAVINVNPGAGTEIEVFCKRAGSTKQVAHYSDVKGTTAVSFASPMDAEGYIVVVDGVAKEVALGETSVDFSATSRNYLVDAVEGVVVKEEGDVLEMTKGEIVNFAERPQQGHNNMQGHGWLHKDFSMLNVKEDSKLHVYPVFWYGQYYHVFGVYTVGANGEVKKQPVFESKSGTNDITVAGKPLSTGMHSFDENSSNGNHWIVASQGFQIDYPVGTEFGFYIDVYETAADRAAGTNKKYTWYSEADRNEDGSFHVGYQIDGDRTFLSFEEDYSADKKKDNKNESNCDINDFMVVIEREHIVLDNDPQPWVIAVEDFGAKDDWDFNDVVISVGYVSGETKATLTPLAAGGIFKVEVLRDGKLIAEGKEFHSWFEGVQEGNYPMINTTTIDKAGIPVEIEVPNTFRMYTCKGIEYMGGFSFNIYRTDGVKTTITAPGQGEAPQMICVPGTWEWTKERSRIDWAYPNFGEWAENYPQRTWLETKNSDYIVK